MIDISLYKVNKNFGFSSIFDNMSFDIKQGEKIALVGDNGSGKTTLLNVIAGYDNVNSGVVSIRKNLKIGYLKQILKEDSDILVKELMYQQFKNIIEIKIAKGIIWIILRLLKKNIQPNLVLSPIL